MVFNLNLAQSKSSIAIGQSMQNPDLLKEVRRPLTTRRNGSSTLAQTRLF